MPRLPQLPAFSGGLVGYFGFETIGYIEPRLAQWDRADELGTPDVLLMLAEEVAVFDNLKGRLYLIVHADPSQPQAYAAAQRRLDALVYRLRQGGASYPQLTQSIALDESDFTSSFTREEFEAMVEKAKEYIRAGDIFQVVPSQRLSVGFNARPVDVYRALRALNPSPYMYFVDLGETQIVGSSPEILARLMDGKVVVRPLAGTRKRGASEEEDQALEAELLADPKERAEHVMLIDLGRNDIGRISETGTVEVSDSFAIERYSHVMHIVSQVQGTPRPGLSYMDVLKATFPAGTRQRRAEDPRAGDHPGTGAVQAQHLRRRDRLDRLVGRCRHRHRDPHRGDPERPPARAGRRRHRLRLRSRRRVGGDDEQGSRAVPRRGAGGEGVVIRASGRCLLAAMVLASGAATGREATQVRWPDTPLARTQALALLQTLNADLLSHDSATLTLERWCGAHHMASPAQVVATRLHGVDKPLPADLRAELGLAAGEPVKYRHVQLRCGDHLLSEADNWYRPQLLTASMNRQLDTSDAPFGKVVQPLHFSRHTLSATLLWSPLPPGWELAPVAAAAPAHTLSIPHAVLQHRAVLRSGSGQPFSVLVETYAADVLRFGTHGG